MATISPDYQQRGVPNPYYVMDAGTMKTAGNQLLNELIRRSNQGLSNLVIEKGSVFKFGKETIDVRRNAVPVKTSGSKVDGHPNTYTLLRVPRGSRAGYRFFNKPIPLTMSFSPKFFPPYAFLSSIYHF